MNFKLCPAILHRSRQYFSCTLLYIQWGTVNMQSLLYSPEQKWQFTQITFFRVVSESAELSWRGFLYQKFHHCDMRSSDSAEISVTRLFKSSDVCKSWQITTCCSCTHALTHCPGFFLTCRDVANQKSQMRKSPFLQPLLLDLVCLFSRTFC